MGLADCVHIGMDFVILVNVLLLQRMLQKHHDEAARDRHAEVDEGPDHHARHLAPRQ